MSRRSRIPTPRDLSRKKVVGERDEISELWAPQEKYRSLPLPGKNIIDVQLASESDSIFYTVRHLIEGKFVNLAGNLYSVIEWTLRIERILMGMHLQENRIRELFWRCLICMRYREFPLVLHQDLPFSNPDINRIFSNASSASTRHPTFLPAALLKKYSPDDLTELSPGPDKGATTRLRKRFIDFEGDIWEPGIGEHVHINKRVFVPDPYVIDLFGSALLEQKSILTTDIREAFVLEPCTGSGVLTLALLKFGARRVCAIDTDSDSIFCARKSATNWNFGNKLDLVQADLTRSALPGQSPFDCVLTNPPWYGSKRDLPRMRLRPEERRCYLDENFVLLEKLLKEAHYRTPPRAFFYLFIGNPDPIGKDRESPETGTLHIGPLGWEIERFWSGGGNVRLYRLSKV